MTIAFVQDVDGGSQELYDRIQQRLGAHEDPPEGLIIHTAGPTDSGWRVVDVWESEDALERFREQRLLPAIEEAVGTEMPAQPRMQINEVYDLIRP